MRQPRGDYTRCGNPAALALGAATTRCSHTVWQSRGARTQCSNHAAPARGAATTRRPHAVRQLRGARTRSGLQPHGARSRCWRHLLRRRFLLWAAAARCTLGAALAAVAVVARCHLSRGAVALRCTHCPPLSPRVCCVRSCRDVTLCCLSFSALRSLARRLALRTHRCTALVRRRAGLRWLLVYGAGLAPLSPHTPLHGAGKARALARALARRGAYTARRRMSQAPSAARLRRRPSDRTAALIPSQGAAGLKARRFRGGHNMLCSRQVRLTGHAQLHMPARRTHDASLHSASTARVRRALALHMHSVLRARRQHGTRSHSASTARAWRTFARRQHGTRSHGASTARRSHGVCTSLAGTVCASRCSLGLACVACRGVCMHGACSPHSSFADVGRGFGVTHIISVCELWGHWVWWWRVCQPPGGPCTSGTRVTRVARCCSSRLR